MNKFIAKNFYKISTLIVLIFIITSIFIESFTIKGIILVLSLISIFLLYTIHKREFEEINSKFSILLQLHSKNGEFLSNAEEDSLYNKVYNEYFNKE